MPHQGAGDRALAKAKLRQTIQEELASRTVQDATENRSTEIVELTTHRQTAKDIAFACDNLEKLLCELEVHADARTQFDQAGNVLDPDPNRQAELDGQRHEVRRLRALAADDTTMETTSVSDYSADPKAPDVFQDASFSEVAGEIHASLEKIVQSIETLTGLVADNPQWWNSAIVMRRIKTHTIRSNYHARRAKEWGNHLRSHMLVTSAQLNRGALEANKELLTLKKQMEASTRRKEELEEKRKLMRVEGQELQKDVERLQLEQQSLSKRMLHMGEEMGMNKPDAARVEAVLLLQKLLEVRPDLRDSIDMMVSYCLTTPFSAE